MRRRVFSLALAAVAALVTAASLRGALAPGARIGLDYTYFLPRLLDGVYFRMQNGPLALEWFTPSFCGGLPRFADGQDLGLALPQLLAAWVDPQLAVYATAVIMSVVGGAGFSRLLTRGFGAHPAVALLGGGIVAWNGAHHARAAAGHLAYHGMMLVPWACAATVAPLPTGKERRWRALADSLVLAACLAYLVVDGMLNLAVPLGLAIVAVALVHALLADDAAASLRGSATRLAAGAALALALSAAKLAAFAGYYASFPRDFYPLPGLPGLWEAVTTAAAGVLGVSPPEAVPLANVGWSIEPHELAYGVGPIPLLALLVGAYGWGKGRTSLGLSPLRAGALFALLLLLAMPIAINVYTPAWNAILKRTPVLSSSSLLVRWWVLYVFVVPLGVLGLERLPPRARDAAALAGLALMALVAVSRGGERQERSWDPASVVAAWRAARATGVAAPITQVGSSKLVTVEEGDALVRGESHQICYEPTFGYRHERFPRGPLHKGPVTDARDGALNLKNPACYVWPRENGCAPGDHFREDQRDALLAFAARRPFPFAISARQRVANAVSLAALAAFALALVALAARRLRRAG